jgi:membrane protein YqaA with SNARE-associated domain
VIKVRQLLKRSILYLEQFSGRWWYDPLLGFLAAADAYIFVISVEAFLLPAVAVRPKKWAVASLWATIGSAIGATSFAYLASRYGESIVAHFIPNAFSSKAWIDSSKYIVEHGFLGLGFISLGPLPQHVAVAVAGLAHMKTLEVFLAVLVGRGIKYFFLSWAMAHSPKLLKKLKVISEPPRS